MKFEYPEIEVVKFAVEDIITASGDVAPSTDPTQATPPVTENMTPWG